MRRVLLGLIIAATIPGAWSQASADQPQLDFANGLFQRGFYEEASEEYRAYLEDEPEGPQAVTAWYRLGESEYALGRYVEAVDALDKALSAGADGSVGRRATLRKACALYRLGRLDQAAPLLADLSNEAEVEDVRAEALYYLGKLRFESGDAASALAAFKTLTGAFPASPLAPLARYQGAFVYLSMDRIEDAAVEFAAVASSDADDALRLECRFRAAEAYDKLGWFDAAVKAYRQLEAEFPGSQYGERAAYGYAWALYHAGDYGEAAKAAQAYVREHPDSVESVGADYLLGNCLYQQKKYDDAVAVFSRIRKEHPGSPFAERAQYKTAWALHMQGRNDDAKTALRAVLQPAGKAVAGDAWFLLGTILAEEGDYTEAYEAFRTVAEQHASSEFAPDALYKAGECLALLERTADAAKVFEQFAAAYPEHALAGEAVLRAGDAEFFSAAFDEAAAKYERILASDPAPNVKEEALYRLAITYHNMQDRKSSVEMFRALLAEFPNGSHAAEAHLRVGDYLLREGKDPLKAVEAYNACLAAGSSGALAGRAHRGMALARYETKDYDGAASLFIELIETEPSVRLDEETYRWVGQRFYDQEAWDRAAAAFRALLETYPKLRDRQRVRLLVAECAEQAGRPADAVALYEAAVADAPDTTVALDAKFRMAKLYEGPLGEPEKAFALYEDAASTNDSDVAARARFRLGELHERQGNFEEAARNYMRIAILFLHEEMTPESLLRAGRCYERAGDAERAMKTYRELVREFPESEQAAQAKERLPAPVEADAHG